MSNFLQCDEPDCDHVETVEALAESLIGKSCPKCGADLLTQADFDHFNLIKDLSNQLVEMFPPADGEELVEVAIGVHDGKMTIDQKDVE